jgi:hypothetical protein
MDVESLLVAQLLRLHRGAVWDLLDFTSALGRTACPILGRVFNG